MDSVLKGNLKPLGDRVIIKPDINEGKDDFTKSGIIIPDSAKENEQSLTGVVLAVGPGKLNSKGTFIPISDFIKVGARVYFGKFTGVDVKQEDGDVTILHEDEIYGVVE